MLFEWPRVLARSLSDDVGSFSQCGLLEIPDFPRFAAVRAVLARRPVRGFFRVARVVRWRMLKPPIVGIRAVGPSAVALVDPTSVTATPGAEPRADDRCLIETAIRAVGESIRDSPPRSGNDLVVWKKTNLCRVIDSLWASNAV